MVCGYLDPKGKLHTCSRWEHMSKAEEIVTDQKLQRVKPYDTCEDVLLHNGWICIRQTDIYKANCDYTGKILFVSDAQLEFFIKHKGELTEKQCADIEDLLRDYGLLHKWHKHEPGYA